MSEKSKFDQWIENNPNKTFLVEYEGGGYDGCFWEWNYSLLTLGKDGLKYTPIYASGYKGQKDLESFKAHYLDLINGGGWNPNAVYIYDLNSEESLREFYKESAPQNIKGVIRFLDDNLDYNEWGEFYPECPICKNDASDSDDMILGDFSGNGGIGVNAHSWHCLECESLYHCSNCNEFDLTSEYRSELEIERINDVLGYNVEDSQICNTCYKIYTDELKEKEEEHNLEQAKNEVIDAAFLAQISLSAWYDYFGGIACQNILTGKVYAKVTQLEEYDSELESNHIIEFI